MNEDTLKHFLLKNGGAIEFTSVAVFSLLYKFIQLYVWEKPEAIYFLQVCYIVVFAFDLYIDNRKTAFKYKDSFKKFLKLLNKLFWVLALLFFSHLMGKYSLLFFWLPEVMYGGLLLPIFYSVIKYASFFGIISRDFYHKLEEKGRVSMQSYLITDAPPLEPTINTTTDSNSQTENNNPTEQH